MKIKVHLVYELMYIYYFCMFNLNVSHIFYILENKTKNIELNDIEFKCQQKKDFFTI